jgi:phospho-N-acetylmuramoyl-pentapeptide-transferase
MMITPTFIKLSARFKASQTILSYVMHHNAKEGTPTMGGIVFIFSSIFVAILFGGYKSSMTMVGVLILAGYGIIGFLDDYIKIRLKRNLGLRAYQKIIAQAAIATIAAIYCAKNQLIGTEITIPLFRTMWEMNGWYIPFAIIVFISMTNAVNLTDGLDGLAGSTNIMYFSTFLIIILLSLSDSIDNGDVIYQHEFSSFSLLIGALIGSLMAYLWFNSHKARLIMGDTGALALGGMAATTALFIKNPLLSIIVGLMFVITSMSVLIQVVFYKFKKRRVFLMAPFHHHLELKGYSESKIVIYYTLIGAIMGTVGLIII